MLAGQGDDPFSLLSTGEVTSVVLSPVLDSTVQDRYGTRGDSLRKGHENDEQSDASLLWGKAERVGNTQTAGDDVQGWSYECLWREDAMKI